MSIRDIARIAGVSASTVSKIMNGKDEDISAETRQKVLKVIEKENYVPYQKYLVKEGMKSHLIGLIVDSSVENRDRLIRTAEIEAEKNGYSLVVRHVDAQEHICDCIRKLGQKNLAGALVLSDTYCSGWQLENRIVWISFTGGFDSRQEAVFFSNPEDTVHQALQILAGKGHRSIAFIGNIRDSGLIDSFQKGLAGLGLSCKEEWICLEDDAVELERTKILQCLGEQVTAVLCGNAEIACRVHRVMEKANCTIPEKLSIISLSENPVLSYLKSGITSVDAPLEEMITDACSHLISGIEYGAISGQRRAYPPKTVQRGSVGAVPGKRSEKSIAVVGSLNMDVFIRLPKPPVTGETQMADSVFSTCGGKGANQAVGAARLGGEVYMIGCLGNDLDSKKMYTALAENHVHMEGVRFDQTLPGGKAYINVDDSGESTIVVYPGANSQLDAVHINRCRHLIEKSAYCLLSTELSAEVAEYTGILCAYSGTKIILKPSATGPLKQSLLQNTEILIPNEKELFQIVPEANSIEEGARLLGKMGVRTVIVTLGERGCYWFDADQEAYFDGLEVTATDTTGGADAFIGALAVALCEEKEMQAAIRFAVCAAGLEVTQYGALPAMPDRNRVDVYVNR